MQMDANHQYRWSVLLHRLTLRAWCAIRLLTDSMMFGGSEAIAQGSLHVEPGVA